MYKYKYATEHYSPTVLFPFSENWLRWWSRQQQSFLTCSLNTPRNPIAWCSSRYTLSSRLSYPNIILSIYGSTALEDLGRFFSSLILYTAGRTPCTVDQSVARPRPTPRTTQTQNKRTQTLMPWVGFEPTIPVFERAKTVHALDRAATVIGELHTTNWGGTWQKQNCRRSLRFKYITCPNSYYLKVALKP
jgi:hypothetical protein